MNEQLLPSTSEFLNNSPLPHLIDGAPQLSAHGLTMEVINPSDGKRLTDVSLGGKHEIAVAVAAAHNAFPGWAKTPATERSALLHRLADRLEKEAATLAQIESLDVGKAISAAEAFDVPFGIEGIRYFADLAVHADYETPLTLKGMDARIVRRPYGVCGFIFPWNFPFDLFIWGVIPALAAGNTVVVKPSEVTPLSTLFVGKIAAEIGLPKGVLNIVVGEGAEAGEALTRHPLVRRMSFTGSTEVGRKIGEICGRRLIPCKLELGGKGAAIVFDDVNVSEVAESLAGAITLNTGQVCCTATRWIVHEAIFEDFGRKVAAILDAVKIGPALDRQTQMGPAASSIHRDRILGYLDQGKSEGANVILDGGSATLAEFQNGYYVKPSLLEGSPENICCREEIFGPSAFLMKFSDEDEAIGLVAELDYGLANSVWSEDLSRAQRVAKQLPAGNAWINAHNVFAYGLPYGGVNRSGLGGGVNSPATFYDYLQDQTVARPLAV